MPTSEARILANRQNSLKSKGPTSATGKEISKRNSLKHGMTGRGIVIPEGDAAEVERRKVILTNELAPNSLLGSILVGQLATLSVRMEKGARQELASTAIRVRHAADAFDEERLAEARGLFQAIGDDPREILRKLRKSPEGVDLMLQSWRDLRAGLLLGMAPRWTSDHSLKAANLSGLRDTEFRGSRLGALLRASHGNFDALAEADGAGLDDSARKGWARARLVEWVDGQIAELEEHYETLDHETIEQDRAEAGDRALFDASRPAALARRYEAEARRGFFRALDQFRKAEAEAEAEVEAKATEPSAASPSVEVASTPLASSRETPEPEPEEEPSKARRPADRAIAGPVETSRGLESRPTTPDRAIPRPS